MWTCALLKRNAKIALEGRYWRCFWVCVLLTILGLGSNSVIDFNAIFQLYDNAREALTETPSAPLWTSRTAALPAASRMMYNMPYESLFSSAFVGITLVLLTAALVTTLCWYIFLVGPLAVGRARYFMESRQAGSPVGTVFSVFDRAYLNVVKVQFLTGLKIALGSLLIIPGIYWSFCYRLVPYLLAENPYIPTRRAMELSANMMLGEKWHSFVLELSFIGWNIVCAFFPFGLGGLFLNPYYQATLAELYAALRSKAFAYKMTDGNELGGFVVRDMQP